MSSWRVIEVQGSNGWFGMGSRPHECHSRRRPHGIVDTDGSGQALHLGEQDARETAGQERSALPWPTQLARARPSHVTAKPTALPRISTQVRHCGKS